VGVGAKNTSRRGISDSVGNEKKMLRRMKSFSAPQGEKWRSSKSTIRGEKGEGEWFVRQPGKKKRLRQLEGGSRWASLREATRGNRQCEKHRKKEHEKGKQHSGGGGLGRDTLAKHGANSGEVFGIRGKTGYKPGGLTKKYGHREIKGGAQPQGHPGGAKDNLKKNSQDRGRRLVAANKKPERCRQAVVNGWRPHRWRGLKVRRKKKGPGAD